MFYKMHCGKQQVYNGILHRDIKPDNFLVVSLEENQKVNCKLTDFGSARNINLLMTNLTFTKGIGTPSYMAPEILNRQHYKKPSDIYSFGVTMYEILTWQDCYPKSEFKFAWDIADFVSSGKRRPKPDDMNDQIYELIEKSWKHNIHDRININDLVPLIETQFLKLEYQ